VARIFPVLLAGFRAFGRGEAVVLYPSDDILQVLQAANPPASVRLQRTGEPIAASAVLTSSGTMSMHCALAGLPGAIAYRTNSLTYLLARWLVKVKYIGIANLLLDEAMYPEFIQNAATPKALAEELRTCCDDPARRERTAVQAARLRALLSEPTTGSAADWLARNLEGNG
jgi:lipid-A-disaccharide synthase